MCSQNGNTLDTNDTCPNIYDAFIRAIKSKEYPAEVPLECHHIQPKHAGGGEEKENKVLLSLEDHMLAHCYRFMVFREKGDKLAWLLRQKQTSEARKLMQELIIATNKERKNLFWNNEWQRKQGLKGGSLGGSVNSPAQFLARQAVGRVYGSIVGRTRQSDRLKKLLNRNMIWRYKDTVSIETLPCDTATAVVAQLNAAAPGKEGIIRNVTTFMKVFYGVRRRMYGWQLFSMAIRSKAEDGLDPSECSETSA